MSGPLFLLFYAALAIAANLWLRHDQRQRETAQPSRFMEIAQDPYLAAYLREGAKAAVRLAIFSLLDRGLLEEANGAVRRTRDDAAAFARRPLEQAVLSCSQAWAEVALIERHSSVQIAALGYESELKQQHLLADARLFRERFYPFAATLALLVGVALARIYWALAHDRHNVGFLIVLALVGGIALLVAWRRRRTGLGDAALARLQVLFAGLKRRAADLLPGGQSNDAVLTAALFGMAALPAERFPYLARVFPKPKSSGDGDSGSGSGASDSGGGCGGGCGGCGGD